MKRCPCGGDWKVGAASVPATVGLRADQCSRCGRWRWIRRKVRRIVGNALRWVIFQFDHTYTVEG